MSEPGPAALHHTCFIVRDLEGTAQRLSDSLGIGPWNVRTIEPAECRAHGKEVLFLDASKLPPPEAVIRPAS